MPAEIIHLSRSHGIRTPIGNTIRTGESAYKQIENLHAEGRLPANSVIVDGSKAKFQKEFIGTLRDSGAEIILDTKAAELSAVGRYQGLAKSAPWARDDRPLNAGDFNRLANIDLYGQIARFAREVGATAVMAPTHFLRDGADDAWLAVDRETVSLLRDALDREGSGDIAIDYPLIVPHTKLGDGDHRNRIIGAIAGLPFDNLVIRLSGFGASSGPSTTKRTLLCIEGLHKLGYPILLDNVGGLIAIGAIAFGFVSGIANGIGERENFHARDWHLPPRSEPDSSFGRTAYFPVPGFDRSFKRDDLNLIAGVSGGRRLVSCHDRACCPNGLTSTQDKPRAHIAYQRFRSMQQLHATPDLRRAQHFLDTEMRAAEHKARDLARLRTGNDKIDSALATGHKRINGLARTFETLIEIDRPTPPALRHRAAPSSAGGRKVV